MLTEAILVELGIAGLQMFFASARAAGLTPEEQVALYNKTDEEYVTVSADPLPSVDDVTSER